MSRRDLFVVLALAAAAAAVYLPALRFELVWDDERILSRVDQAWREGGAAGVLRLDYSPQAGVVGYYRPIPAFSLLADGSHLTNILLHAAAAALLFLLLRRLLPPGPGPAVASLLFAVHPAAVDVVGMVTNRSDAWAAVFLLASAILWLRWREGGRLRELLLSLLLFLGGLLSKESAIVFPGLLVLWDLLLPVPARHRNPEGGGAETGAGGPSARWRKRNLPILAGWGAAIAVALAARATAGVGFGTVDQAALSLGEGPMASTLQLPGRWVRLAELLLVPHRLSPWYLPQDLPLTPLGAGASTALLAGFLLLTRRLPRLAGMGAACLLIFLLPVSGIIPIGGAIVRDYYVYLPSIGIFLAVGAALGLPSSLRARRAAVAAALAWGAFLAFQSASHLPVWRDEVTLFAHMHERSPGSRLALSNLWAACFREGRVDEGLAAMEELARSAPWSANWRNLAGWADLKGRPEMAERARRMATEGEKRERKAALERGLALEREGLWEEAEKAYREALPPSDAVPPPGSR